MACRAMMLRMLWSHGWTSSCYRWTWKSFEHPPSLLHCLRPYPITKHLSYEGIFNIKINRRKIASLRLFSEAAKKLLNLNWLNWKAFTSCLSRLFLFVGIFSQKNISVCFAQGKYKQSLGAGWEKSEKLNSKDKQFVINVENLFNHSQVEENVFLLIHVTAGWSERTKITN